jgi:hypothetical protein
MEKRTKYETSPERLAAIQDTLDALLDESGGRAADHFDNEEDLRALAQRLQLPYLAVLTTQFGLGSITETDVEEYNAWRAKVDAVKSNPCHGSKRQ